MYSVGVRSSRSPRSRASWAAKSTSRSPDPERRRPARGRRHLVAAQDGADAGHQLEVVERLRDVVVGAELQALDLVHRVVARRQHHHGHVGEGADLAQDVEAVDVREARRRAGRCPGARARRRRAPPRRCRRRATSTSRHWSVNPRRTDSTTSGSSSTTRIRITRSSGGPSVGTTSVNMLPSPEHALARRSCRRAPGRSRAPSAGPGRRPRAAPVPVVAADEEALEEPRPGPRRDARTIVGHGPGRVVTALATCDADRIPPSGAYSRRWRRG